MLQENLRDFSEIEIRQDHPMSDLKLIRTSKDGVAEIHSGSVVLQKSLQKLIETNLEIMVGVRLLASEYTIARLTVVGLIPRESMRTLAGPS